MHKHEKDYYHNHMRHHPYVHNPTLDDFFVVTVISNSVRYKRRYELYDRFARMCASAGVKLITVEQAFGDRPHMVTSHDNPFHLQVRTVEELWHKENMGNLGVAHGIKLFPNAKAFAFVDADCAPVREPRDWFEETWHELQHYQCVQMWEHMMDVDHYFAPIGGPQPGFMANYVKYGTPNPEEFKKIEAYSPEYSKVFGRPGLAWAFNIDAFNQLGGFYEHSILGAGDWYMAHGLIGAMKVTSEASSMGYVKSLLQWQERAERWIKRDVGFVRGLVYHYFHGRKNNRFYGTRGKILIENQFDPSTDVKRDAHGMLQLETWEPRQIKLRDQIRGYFRARDEDCIYSGDKRPAYL